MTAEAKKQAIDAAISIATDITNGDLDPAALDAAVAAKCRELVGQVLGPDDDPAIWELQQDIARQVMAVGGCWPAHELYEWAAATALREGATPNAQKAWIEQALAQYDGQEQQEDPDG